MRPVVEEAAGALLAAAVVYTLALAFGYVQGPRGQLVFGIASVALLAYPVVCHLLLKRPILWPLRSSRYASIRRLADSSASKEFAVFGLFALGAVLSFAAGALRSDIPTSDALGLSLVCCLATFTTWVVDLALIPRLPLVDRTPRPTRNADNNR